MGAVAGLKDLDWLELIQNHISVLPDFSGLERLTYVGLDSNSLGDITPLAQLPAHVRQPERPHGGGGRRSAGGPSGRGLRLFLNGDNDFYRHLDGKTVKTLHPTTPHDRPLRPGGVSVACGS